MTLHAAGCRRWERYEGDNRMGSLSAWSQVLKQLVHITGILRLRDRITSPWPWGMQFRIASLRATARRKQDVKDLLRPFEARGGKS